LFFKAYTAEMGNHGGDLAYSNDYDNPELGSGVSGSFLDNNQNLKSKKK
jgi:hypothetical protein